MTLKDTLVTLVERLTDAHIYRVLPRGLDLRHDIANALRAYQVGVVFDVGANIGQWAQKCLSWFPNADVYSFEPVERTFRQLLENVQGNERVHCIRQALGSSSRTGTMVLEGTSDMHFMLDEKDAPACHDAPTEAVDIVTVDAFCRAGGIDGIHYLKIDTEGGDLEVLKGADAMLACQAIDLVEVEAGMHAANKRHVPFEVLKEHLQSRGYSLFGIYEQVTEWPTKETHLRRANVAFISRRMIEANRG
jgi:FkbM family methyltransferase